MNTGKYNDDNYPPTINGALSNDENNKNELPTYD